ncbi:MAG: nitroreductase family protein, partial [Planctomycetota bacterium]
MLGDAVGVAVLIEVGLDEGDQQDRGVLGPGLVGLDIVKRRWSPRAFADRPVEDHKLRCILEAARWSASSYNEQPWRFILAKKADGAPFDTALSCLAEANQAWAKNAPILLITFVKTDFD